MIGMDDVSVARKQGVKPKSVFVRLVLKPLPPKPSPNAMSDFGIVTVQIGPSDSLGSVDWRLLTGLMVCLEDFTGNARRFQAVKNLILEAAPEALWMPTADGLIDIHRVSEKQGMSA